MLAVDIGAQDDDDGGDMFLFGEQWAVNKCI